MKQEEVIKCLRQPFPFGEVEWKIQVTTQDKTRGMAVAYIDSRAIQKRLDEVVGAFNWQNIYATWQDKSQICGISIFNDERREWVTKFDGAENTDFEPIKGGLSDAFKRAAIQWGVGRYLYELTGIWVEIEQRGKSSNIKDNQYPKLEAAYNHAVVKMFGTVTNQGNPPAIERKTTANPKKTGPKPAAMPTQPSDSVAKPDYKVQSVKPSGKESQLIELVNADGHVIPAYIKNSDKGIKIGSMLRDVDLVQKNSSYGQYYLINKYKLAA